MKFPRLVRPAGSSGFVILILQGCKMKFPRFAACLLAVISVNVSAAELPVLHLRTASSPPPIVATLQDPAKSAAWYPSSPTWFGLGGKTPDRNHTEILATYDNSALYIAFLNIDRSSVKYPKNTTTDLTTVDTDAIWIQTPSGRRFYLMACIDNNYPPGPRQASGEFPSFDPKADKLSGWTHAGWYAGDKSMQQTIRIPWSTLQTSAPVSGAKWRVNFVSYNQTSTTLTSSTVYMQKWAPGTESQPEQWGYLAFDQAAPAPPLAVSAEAVLTLRPGTGYGGETTLRAGDYADQPNKQLHEAITQSNWNDWDPIQYTIKEYLQYDLSMIPQGRKIISAKLLNNFRGHYESYPTDLYLHVVRLASYYDPKTVTMLTSPLPVENGFRRLVKVSEKKAWIEFDVTDAVRKAFDSGAQKTAFALAGSSGDIHNGKIWNVSFGRADWYDKYRPKLVITFGNPARTFSSPVNVGSGNCWSVATSASKNKLTNGTFAYGTVEGNTNTTYWDAGTYFVYSGGVNVPLMQLKGDVNPNTGHKALRFMCPATWKSMKQYATGITSGKSYTLSGWWKGSAPGIKSDVRFSFRDAAGVSLSSGQAVYSGSGSWATVKLTKTAPSGTAYARIDIVNETSGSGAYMLYSDFQLEAGTTPTAYSETMGVYYPSYPRTDGASVTTATYDLSTTGPVVSEYTSFETDCAGVAKEFAAGTLLKLNNMVVTETFSDSFRVQDTIPDHDCGMRVISAEAPEPGSLVDVTGTLGTDQDGEIVLKATSITPSGSDREVEPSP
ncbi:MAG: DNRLRE domain-containing protein [Armatimonadota bacterium]|nr:DNRLRE domain-containing protein [Armatimonadota bacterium]